MVKLNLYDRLDWNSQFNRTLHNHASKLVQERRGLHIIDLVIPFNTGTWRSRSIQMFNICDHKHYPSLISLLS
jgi:hypothetical protein